MSDTNNRPKQDGSLRGQNVGPLPDRGTGTGVTDSYGADLGGDARNRKGGFSATSDPAADQFPPGGGDFSGSSHFDPSNGRGFSADSDPADETDHDDQRDMDD